MSDDQDLAIPAPAPGARLLLHWRSLSDGLLISFIISAPTLFAALVLRDQRSKHWYGFLALAAIGFLIGGVIAGRHRRALRGAAMQGIALGFFIATIVLLANLVRDLSLSHHITSRSLELWVGIEVGAMMVAIIGSVVGRRIYRSIRKKKSGF
jgi:hypothetical protein